MGNKKIIIDNFSINYYHINTLIVGSGAASLNAAVSLHSLGQKDILIATSKWGGGTSNNAGSDKQTYYKLSIAGTRPDSVAEMAIDLFNGKCMHGDIALCEAQGSVQAFMNLVRLGVPFPHDKFGSYPGYKTDHDPRARATSAGPYTSKMMFNALASQVKQRKIKRLDHHQVIALLTDSRKSKIAGALAIDLKEKDPIKAFVLINSTNIILGTGGPGDIYEASVYPLSQNGSTGMAFRAGATGQNLTESQFGIGSIKFRWNLSGSYQQVIPRYISTDKNGNDEKEFLNDFFPDYTTLTKAIFLKGYQWPFDPRKISDHGSSLIDLLVFKESVEEERRVFIDFRNNPSWGNNESFMPDRLNREVRHYLESSDAMKSVPVERLQAMNNPAFNLYLEHGIDLTREPLEIAVCAQHNNGGLKSTIWWESDLRHLFPVGEVNGSHGVYRPGGSALNAGQVGSYRAAQFISRIYNSEPPGINEFLAVAGEQIREELGVANYWLSSGKAGENFRYLSEIRKRMSAAGSIIRKSNELEKAAAEALSLLRKLKDIIGAASVRELAGCFLLADQCLTHYIYLKSISEYISKGGRSRGSWIISENDLSEIIDDAGTKTDHCQYDRDIERNILEAGYRNGKVRFKSVKVRDIPVQNLWFETVWKDYLEDNFIES